MMVNAITIEDELMYKQLMDPKLKEIAVELEVKENKYFALINGLLFRNYQNKRLFVIPENMINNIIRIYHDNMGHVGIDNTVHGIIVHYWFPCLKGRVRQYIKNCVQRLSYSIATGKTEGEMEIFDKATTPMCLMLKHA